MRVWVGVDPHERLASHLCATVRCATVGATEDSAGGELLGPLKRLFSSETDQMLLRARASGERVVATVRLSLVLALTVLGLALGPRTDGWILAVAGLVAVGYSVILFWLAFQVRRGWVPWLSCAADVTMISGALLFLLRFWDAPIAVTNSRTFYDLYFLAIMNAGLRYDWRLCIWTSVLAAAEYVGLTMLAVRELAQNGTVDVLYGSFSWQSQWLRVALLLIAGGIMSAVAFRARSLRLMVGVDHLTGLSQRAPFIERIDEELSRSRRRGSPMSVAILDIDGFKGFNDAFGHPSGDRALQIVSSYLRSSVRKSDLVARFGGEEFVIAFPETEVALATSRMEAIRAEIARLPIPVGKDVHRLTISAGVGSWPVDGDTFEAVLDRADTRLFDAKRQGRNQVVGPPPAEEEQRLATVTELKKR
jgi:diguanylate cyclase (GGDEF)-like protein